VSVVVYQGIMQHRSPSDQDQVLSKLCVPQLLSDVLLIVQLLSFFPLDFRQFQLFRLSDLLVVSSELVLTHDAPHI